MNKINLLGTNSPSSPTSSHYRGMVDLQILSNATKACLKQIITYRNSPTGAGIFRSGMSMGTKLEAGTQFGIINNLDLLNIRLKEAGIRLPKEAEARLKRSTNLIFRFFTRMKADVHPLLSEAIAVSAKKFPEVAVGDQSHHDPEYLADISKRIFIPEMIALDYLKLIDMEIDVILHLFGLTRRSVIS